MAKPKPIRSILESTLKGLEIDIQLKTHSIWSAWKEIVGESVARNAQPRSIRNRILFIDVSHQTWIQQLQFLKPVLLEKVNTFMGEPHIHDIRFKLGKMPALPPVPPKESDWRDEKLDTLTLSRVESILQKLQDEETRESLRNILTQGAKLEQQRRKLKQ
jgi:hypothetical protein